MKGGLVQRDKQRPLLLLKKARDGEYGRDVVKRAWAERRVCLSPMA